jgi:hypothetical protein
MTIFGWDASHYDATPTGSRVVSEGFSFFTHKAGGDANDAALGSWWSAMKPYRNKVLLGAYWVLYPGSPTARANAFCDRLDAVCPGWGDAPFILQADCEIWGGNSGTLPSRAEIEAFCDRLRVRAPKLMPVVYGPKWCYGNALTGLNYPLWASSYVSGSGAASSLYPGDSSTKWGAYSGQVPQILQFTSSATIAGQTTCDANAYRGTLAELTKLLAPGWAETIEDEAMAFIENQAAFNDALAKAFADADVRKATAAATWLTDGVLPAPADAAPNADGTPNAYWTAWGLLGSGRGAAVSARTYSNQTLALAQQLVATSGTGADAAALATALAPLLNGVTAQQIEDALRDVLREGVGPVAVARQAAGDDQQTRVAREQAQRRIAGPGE